MFLLVPKIIGQWANIRISDPRNWGGGQGTVDEAILSMQPRGCVY